MPSKFVRGDAIAGIMIVAVNIVGGIIIGMFAKGMDIGPSAAGLHPADHRGRTGLARSRRLIISTAAGIIVTRTATGTNFSGVSKQFLQKPKAIAAAGACWSFMALVPGLAARPIPGHRGGCCGVAARLA